MDLQLQKRVAIVTGGGTGIGLGIAELLAEEGAKVVLAGRRADVLQRAAEKISANPACEQPVVIPIDLSASGGGTELARNALAKVGRVDIVVNNAGVSQPMSTGSPDELWDAAYLRPALRRGPPPDRGAAAVDEGAPLRPHHQRRRLVGGAGE